MRAVVLPAASADFTSTQVIFSNSTKSACACGAACAHPAASIRQAVPAAMEISQGCAAERLRVSLAVSCGVLGGLGSLARPDGVQTQPSLRAAAAAACMNAGANQRASHARHDSNCPDSLRTAERSAVCTDCAVAAASRK